MLTEAGNSELTQEQKSYIRAHGAKIPQPRPVQLFLNKENLPSDIESWSDLLKANKEGRLNVYDFGEPVMPWDYDLTCLEQDKSKSIISKAHKPDAQSRFLVKDNGVVILPRALNRDDFGPGHAGQMAFNAMMFGEGCERIIDAQKRERCGKEPVEVLDFDVAADLEQRLICGIECRISMKEEVRNDLSKQGRSTVFGINGHGRS